MRASCGLTTQDVKREQQLDLVLARRRQEFQMREWPVRGKVDF